MKKDNLLNFDRRQGVTLVEMLTVVGLMMFLVAIAVPAFNVNNQEKQIVNAARSLQAYITEARAKAILTGLPCGVAFIPYEGYPEACIRAQLVETPPVFCGYTQDATCMITSEDTLTPSVSGLPDEWKKAGNKIRFNGKGQWYILGSDGRCSPVNNQSSSGGYQNYRPWSTRAPSGGEWKTSYEIQAVPVAQGQNYLQTIGMASPLKFPRGLCVDLYNSGYKESATFNKQSQPVYIMFSPTGQVESYYSNSKSNLPSGKLYFLMGKWDRTIQAVTPEDGLRNFQDYDCCWVVIDPEMGTVKVQPIIDNSNLSSSRTVI